jgi:cbb3-type cytochrome oxidase subunit 3
MEVNDFQLKVLQKLIINYPCIIALIYLGFFLISVAYWVLDAIRRKAAEKLKALSKPAETTTANTETTTKKKKNKKKKFDGGEYGAVSDAE